MLQEPRESKIVDSQSGEVATTIPTVGFNDETVENKNSNSIVCDVGGEDETRRHYHGMNELIYVVDSNGRESIEEEDCRFSTSALNDQVVDATGTDESEGAKDC